MDIHINLKIHKLKDMHLVHIQNIQIDHFDQKEDFNKISKKHCKWKLYII